jgi:hypothetical protein
VTIHNTGNKNESIISIVKIITKSGVNIKILNKRDNDVIGQINPIITIKVPGSNSNPMA